MKRRFMHEPITCNAKVAAPAAPAAPAALAKPYFLITKSLLISKGETKIWRVCHLVPMTQFHNIQTSDCSKTRITCKSAALNNDDGKLIRIYRWTEKRRRVTVLILIHPVKPPGIYQKKSKDQVWQILFRRWMYSGK